MLISVITPTYNRAYILPRCYESLLNQINQNFEWIIINDGSSDNTDEIVAQLISEGKIHIKYLKQENGGKHRAHNAGVMNASGELCVCVDSDDALSADAVDTAIGIWEKCKDRNDIIGILALRGDFASHEPICSRIPEDLMESTMSDLFDIYGFSGDTVLFFRTDVLKKHLFREFDDEKFLTENNMYCDLDQVGKMFLLNQVLYYCEYLPDGLTAHYQKILANNPKGTADTYYRMAVISKSAKKAFKYAIIAQSYKSLARGTGELNFRKKKLMFLIAYIGVPFFRLKYLKKTGD